MKLFVWSIIQKALPLGENLQQRGLLSGARCKRCNEVETAIHTFFRCPFAQEVWKRVPLNCVVHLATLESFTDVVVALKRTFCLPPTGITGTILPWICWVIWIARNQLVFENKPTSPAEAATKGLRLAREWSSAQSSIEVIKTPKPRGTHSRRRMQLTVEDPLLMTCRSDAAWDVRTKRAGLAWILTDSKGSCITQETVTQDKINSPLIAEALALRSALLSAGNLGFPKLRCFSDNETLIRAINGDMHVKEIFGIVMDIKQLSSAFIVISFSHFFRSQNVETDGLAKQSLSSSLYLDPFVG
ncbi:uncharacterized protein LOC108836659 [Raphanus sativus]|uniref:Uncharacterized protein LOC108836659 n=1 Tax=Raphanus sativus TaxID=3726 RepID=A0A6J0M0V3_RAPSA|nr:uncharacterized protein LOC108836659 [Raphanus sativus]